MRSVAHALRGLRRSPGVPAACAVAIGISAGASTAVFAIVYSVLLRPLPFRDPDRLVQLTATTADRVQNFSLPEFDDWTARTSSFESLALFMTAPVALSVGSQTFAIRPKRMASNDATDPRGERADRQHVRRSGLRTREESG